jgi:hypothetical protein
MVLGNMSFIPFHRRNGPQSPYFALIAYFQIVTDSRDVIGALNPLK